MSTTPTMQITGKQLIEAVRDIAAADPDHVYTRPYKDTACYYRNPETNEPDCIIGRALDALGVLPQEMGLNNTVGVLLLLNQNKPVIPVEADEVQLVWLTRVQHHQDAENTWGNAVRKADAAAVLLDPPDPEQ